MAHMTGTATSVAPGERKMLVILVGKGELWMWWVKHTWALGLGSHLHHASGAARGAGRVVPDGGWSSALASQGGGNRGAGSNTGKHGWMLRICRVLLKEVAREDGLSETTDRLFVATSGWVGGDCLVKC